MKEICWAIILIISCNVAFAQKTKNSNVIKDIDGNLYKTVKIGSQVWISENLRTTKLNDGLEIVLIEDSKVWQDTKKSAYCWYDNDSVQYSKVNGALYNWYAVNTGKLCPVGFHVPSDSEWELMTDFLGGNEIAGAKLKVKNDSLWNNHSRLLLKSVGFNAFPSGYRNKNGPFGYMGGNCFWWSATIGKTSDKAWDRNLYGYSTGIYRYASQLSFGFSVRCLKD